eukprot:scaffold13210_cov109-Isochrysis_galbana.AAC.5
MPNVLSLSPYASHRTILPLTRYSPTPAAEMLRVKRVSSPFTSHTSVTEAPRPAAGLGGGG